jgi:hypothetical protein
LTVQTVEFMAKRHPGSCAPKGDVLALARRLYPGHLPTLFERLDPGHPRPLDPLEIPQAETLLWAAIGRKLAEKEPDFRPGRRRKPGSKNKKAPVPHDKARQKWRDGKRDRENRSVPGYPDLVLEDGVSLKAVWER